MELFQADTLIRALRIGQGMTQAMLCDGICSQDELSRIEQGKRRPNWWIFERLLQRLGEDPQRYYTNYVSKSEKRIMDVRIQLRRLLNEGTLSADDEAEVLISELEKDRDFGKREHRQFLLRQKATLAFHRKEYKEMLRLSLEAFKITKPDFNEDKVDNYILFYDEIKLIEQIAVAYFYDEQVEKSIKILEKLKVAVEKNCAGRDKRTTDLSILYNLSTFLGCLEKYKEAIPYCDAGLKLCHLYYDSYYHPLFLLNKAFDLLHLGKKEEGIFILKKAYALFFALDRLTELETVKKGVADQFGFTVFLELLCHSHREEEH